MRLWRALSSPRLAASLIVALLALALLSVVVPQTAVFGSAYVARWRTAQPWLAVPLLALGLDRVFSSWPYWLVSALLVLNLASCTVDRVRKRRPLAKVPVAAPPADAASVRFPGTAEEAASLLRGRLRTYEMRASGTSVVCRSGRFGFAGSIAMHLGIVVIVVAGLTTGLTRFEGTMLLAEGQTLPDTRQAYLTIARMPRLGDPFTDGQLRLDKLEFDYDGSTVTGARAFVTTSENNTTRSSTAEVNRPLAFAGKSFLPQDAGYAAGLRVTSPTGEKALDAVVNLGEQSEAGSADRIVAGPLVLDLLAVPDARVARGTPAPSKLVPRDPGVWLSAEASGTAVVRDRLVRPGQAVEAGGWRIELLELKRWNRFDVRRDYGLPVAAAGFVLLAGGMAVRLGDPDRVVRVTTARGQASVWAGSRWGRGIAEAAERVALEALSSDMSGEREAREQA